MDYEAQLEQAEAKLLAIKAIKQAVIRQLEDSAYDAVSKVMESIESKTAPYSPDAEQAMFRRTMMDWVRDVHAYAGDALDDLYSDAECEQNSIVTDATAHIESDHQHHGDVRRTI